MANAEQEEELDSIRALYDGSQDVFLQQEDYGFCVRIGQLQLRLMLQPEYLASEFTAAIAPGFELSSPTLAHCALSCLCQHLDNLFAELGGGPTLIVWIEWLRMEAAEFLDALHLDQQEPVWDARAVGIPYPLEDVVPEIQEELPAEPMMCALCSSVLTLAEGLCLPNCGHTLCSTCKSMAVQVHSANNAVPRCPLPQCRSEISEDVVDQAMIPEAWAMVSRRILRTSFQEAIAFCPRCEDRGMDIPVLTSSKCISEELQAGLSRCCCFQCKLMFCGICRSPSHDGEACLAEGSRIVRMGKRRPPLPPDLAEIVAEASKDVVQSEKQKSEELKRAVDECSSDFQAMRRAFLSCHEADIYNGLGEVFAAPIKLTSAPVQREVQLRFMESLANTGALLRPAFHGTDYPNHSSIFRRGLLIPGENNELKVVHGAAHGRGVYTANIDAAWLSRGFCSAPAMLVCAVLQTHFVHHVGDAMVVGVADHVVPLFEATAGNWGCSQTIAAPAFPIPPAPMPRHTVTAPPAACTKGTARAKGSCKNQQPSPPQTKSSKFMARLGKKSQKH